MQVFRRSRFLIVILIPAFLFAQPADDAAKEKQRRKNVLIEQILTDLPNLKSGENRALVYVKVGNLIWDADQKQAILLFQNAVGELIGAQTRAETDKRPTGYQNELLTGGNTRPQILNTIANRNAELALEMLVKSRPAAITKALAAGTTKTSKISDGQNLVYLAQNEINLEQNFLRLAADQNPDRAIKILKESLSKGLSNETLSLLKKLADKDAESAGSLASSVIDKLIRDSFAIEGQPNYQRLQIASGFLNEFINNQNNQNGTKHALKFDESQVHRLADKLFSYYLDQNGQNGYVDYSVLTIAEKLSPSIVDQLKKVVQGNSRRGDFGGGYDPDLQKLLGNGDTTADQLLAVVAKYPVNSQRQIYQTAANKLVQQGNIGGASAIINDNFSDEAREEALRNLNWQYSSNLINTGKFAEAERMIDDFPENNRSGALVNLANSIYQKNPTDNKSYALTILEKARNLISEKPETSPEMGNLFQVISGYANIEPAEAFRMYEPLIPQMNELADAAAIINGFQGNYNIRDREFSLSQGNNYGFYGADYSVLNVFAKSDFDRTMALIDSFSHQEIRISLRLQMVESGLN